MFNLEEEIENADEDMHEFVDSLKVKDLKRILTDKDINYDNKLLKQPLKEKLTFFLSNELKKLRSNDEDILQLLPVWVISLCKERVQWLFYHCDSKVDFETASDALEFQKDNGNISDDDEDDVNDNNSSYCSSDESSSKINSSGSMSSGSSTSSSKKSKIGNADPKMHIGKSTFDFSMDVNQKVRAKHSRLGFRERIVMKQQKKIHEKNSGKKAADEERIKTLKCHDLFCCDAIDPVTKSQCIAGPFVSEYFLKKHQELCEKGHRKHIFPSINSTTCVLIDIQQGKTSPLCLACGAIQNRDDAVAGIYPVRPPKPLPECIDPCCTGDGCYRRDNKRWKHKQFRATPELLNDLEALFEDGENRSKGGTKKNAGKYSATEAVAVLKNMMDSNGRRKYRLEGPSGRLPTEKYVKSWFGRRKNKGAKVFLEGSTRSSSNNANIDKYSCLTLEELKYEFEKAFDRAPTNKILCMKLLEIDDDLKYEGHDNIYTGLTLDELEKECKSRSLPFVVGSKGLKILLRSHTMRLNSKRHKAAVEYNDAVNITDAAEEILLHGNKIRDDQH